MKQKMEEGAFYEIQIENIGFGRSKKKTTDDRFNKNQDVFKIGIVTKIIFTKMNRKNMSHYLLRRKIVGEINHDLGCEFEPEFLTPQPFLRSAITSSMVVAK
jgi:hypothetical protein